MKTYKLEFASPELSLILTALKFKSNPQTKELHDRILETIGLGEEVRCEC